VVLPVAPLPVARAVLAEALPGIDPFAVPLEPAPPRSRWRSPLQFRRLAVGNNEHVLVARHGWLVPKWDVVPHARTQSVRMTQGPWQRRLQLASVHIDSTPGPVHITAAQRDEGSARRLVEAQSHRGVLLARRE
jgi:putative membrane protein